MGIEIEKSFSIDAPRDAVWRFLTDPHRVARALPGTEITEQVDERTYKGKTSLKVGPISASYKGRMTFERLDEEAGEAELKASAQDVGGRGAADLRMRSKVVELESGGTEVTVVSEVNVMGLLAQLGRGMIRDVSDVLFDQFTQSMRAELAAPETEQAVPAPAPEELETTTEPAAPAVEQSPPEEAAPESARRLDESSTDPVGVETLKAFDASEFSKEVARRALKRRLTSPGLWIGVVIVVMALIWLLSR